MQRPLALVSVSKAPRTRPLALGLGFFWLGWGCGDKQPQTPPKDQDAATDKIPAALQGSYRETWRESPKGISDHDFQPASWRRNEGGQFPRDETLELQAVSQVQGGHWALVFQYPQGSSLHPRLLRLDAVADPNEHWWICIRPQPTDPQGKPSDLDPANSADLELRGCQGAPWRHLVPKQDAP